MAWSIPTPAGPAWASALHLPRLLLSRLLLDYFEALFMKYALLTTDMHRVYLDNNATTPLLPEVFEAMRPYFFEKFGNASSIHRQGQQARAAVEHAREQVAELLNCRPAEIVFTSGGTEGDNLALFGLMKPGDHIITSAVEHHAVLNACKRLEEMGCAVTYLPVDGQAMVDPDDVRRAIRPATTLISIILGNNETGVL